jgi:four helix bundle protein
MTEHQLKYRAKQFALRVLKLVDSLPTTTTRRAIVNHLIRSGTPVGANYRSPGGGRSCGEFISKRGVVREEAEECRFWFELMIG